MALQDNNTLELLYLAGVCVLRCMVCVVVTCGVCGADNKTLGDDGAVAVGDAVAAGHMTNLKTLYLHCQ